MVKYYNKLQWFAVKVGAQLGIILVAFALMFVRKDTPHIWYAMVHLLLLLRVQDKTPKNLIEYEFGKELDLILAREVFNQTLMFSLLSTTAMILFIW